MQKRAHIQRFLIGKRILSMLLLAFSLLIVLYGYFISSSIINVLVRKEVDREITTLSSRVSELETEYLIRKNEITLQYAYAHGFQDITDKQFTARASHVARSLTFNTETP